VRTTTAKRIAKGLPIFATVATGTLVTTASSASAVDPGILNCGSPYGQGGEHDIALVEVPGRGHIALRSNSDESCVWPQNRDAAGGWRSVWIDHATSFTTWESGSYDHEDGSSPIYGQPAWLRSYRGSTEQYRACGGVDGNSAVYCTTWK
jgi:hypothetical protein